MDYRIYDSGSSESEVGENYRCTARRKTVLIAAALVICFLLLFLSLFISNLNYGLSDIASAFFTHDESSKIGTFIWNIDLPIGIAAIVAGASLSLAGVIMQCILKNPLASPYTLGLSNAAAFGAAFSIIFITDGVALSSFGNFVTPVAAFLMSMVAIAIVIVLAKVTKVSSETMVLAGIAVSAIFSAGMTLMQYIADPIQLGAIVSWTFGSVSTASWGWDLFLSITLVMVSVYTFLVRWDMNAMEAGDEVSKGLGVNTDVLLITGLILSALVAACTVSKFGVIAFVGLLGPHMARMLVGSDYRYLVPMAILCGAILLLAANIVALNIALPRILPVGLLTSLLGGPAFIVMLVRRYRAS